MRRFGWITLVASLGVAGCGGLERIATPCCYRGEVTATRFDALYLETRDGKKYPFEQIFTGFKQSTGLFALTYPVHQDISIREVVHAPLAQVLPSYDANKNNSLEVPELTVLYIQETARGLGYDVVALGTNPRAQAIAAAPADVGGLMSFINANQANLSPRSRHIFRDLHYVAEEQRLDVTGADRDSVIPP